MTGQIPGSLKNCTSQGGRRGLQGEGRCQLPHPVLREAGGPHQQSLPRPSDVDPRMGGHRPENDPVPGSSEGMAAVVPGVTRALRKGAGQCALAAAAVVSRGHPFILLRLCCEVAFKYLGSGFLLLVSSGPFLVPVFLWASLCPVMCFPENRNKLEDNAILSLCGGVSGDVGYQRKPSHLADENFGEHPVFWMVSAFLEALEQIPYSPNARWKPGGSY